MAVGPLGAMFSLEVKAGISPIQQPVIVHWVYELRQSDVFWSICRLRSYRASGFLFGTVPHRALTYRITD